MIKYCKYCGKPFESKSGTKVYCDGQHYRECVVCGTKFPITISMMSDPTSRKTCSKKCTAILKKQTCEDKYGGPAPASSKEVQAKMRFTTKERYGVELAAQSKEIQERMKNTVRERYGVDYVMQNPDVVETLRSNVQQKYGVDWVTQIDDVKTKTIQTNQQRYGTDNVMQSDKGKIAFKRSHMHDPTKLNNLLEFQKDPKQFISRHFDQKPSLRDLAISIGVNSDTASKTLYEHNCIDLVGYTYSYLEKDIQQFISEIDPTIQLQCNTRRIITPYELDIYLPQYKLGIECNPTATHNASVNVFDRHESAISAKYHQMKTDLCESQGIFLFHLFGYEWNHKEEIMKSMIRNLLGKNESKIYARNTYIKEISGSDATRFIDANHRQGHNHSSVNIGLFDKTSDNLVSVMTFIKMRNTIGTSSKEDLSECWELARFCNRLNTSVVGGASKLFKYFVKTHCPKEVRSFSDRARTRGKLYETLGFSELRRSSAGYVWVDSKTDIPYSRVNAQKQNICKFLHDDSIDLSQTEKEIMESHGYLQVFDSGTITWQWLSQ